MTKEDMYKAGGIVNKTSITDEELHLALEATKLVLAFLDAKGHSYDLARIVLGMELNALSQMKFHRDHKPEFSNG